MYGGLKKSVSLVALVAAAGIFSTGANSADLGGDCCADLEERVAELEATTVRKGTRRVSLTLSGQVNRATMYFNDGVQSNTYFGLDNTNNSTRFGLSGSAKVTPQVSAGFSILLDVTDKARTATVTQGNQNATSGSAVAGANADHFIAMRDANWWLEHSSFGRLTVGRLTPSGAIAGIDLAGVQVVASSGPALIGGGLLFRDTAGVLTRSSIGNSTDGAPSLRTEGIRYNSPAFAGFTFGASIGESASLESAAITAGNANTTNTGRSLGADLRYAGEFSGVRVAAGIGWENKRGSDNGYVNAPAAAAPTPFNEYTAIGGSLALMHVPTGLFIQGDYTTYDITGLGLSAPGQSYVGDRTATRWLVQGGIAQNWFGIGRTTLYAEYGKAEGWQDARGLNTAPAAINNDEVRHYGLGVVQAIDAAAMDLYLGWRNFEGKNLCTAAANAAAATACTVGATQSIDVVTAGARIRF